MKTRTIVRNAVAVAAAAGAGVALSAVAASASTSASTFHGHPSLTPMTGPRSFEAEIATITNSWHHAQPYALTNAGRMPVLERLPFGSPSAGQMYARDQRFTELHNSAVTELAFSQRIHGRTEVLTEQGGRLVFEQLNRHGAAADQLWTWTAGTAADSWSFKNVGTGRYLTALRHGGVGISSMAFVWQQVELPAA
jgi:hypothetical protein